MIQSTAKSVSEYVAQLPTERREAIQIIRNVILENLPDGCVETMQYGMIGYVVVSTSETDPETNFPKKLGMINGGFFKKTKETQHSSVVIGVHDIREAMNNVEKAGGKVLGGQKIGEPDDIPGVGLYVSFIDTEGNRVGMIQPTGMMGSVS